MINIYRSRILRKLGIARISDWGVAFRCSDSFDSLFADKKDKVQFASIENTQEFWFADPLLFEDSGKTWLFVEAFSKTRKKGELGVFDIIDGKPCNFRLVITTDKHMSYPFVFKYQGEYYMIPETGAEEEIALFRATSFPDHWVKDKVLLKGNVYRDSTIFKKNELFYVLSYRQTGDNLFNRKNYLSIFELNMDEKKLEPKGEVFDRKKCLRPAGPVFQKDGQAYMLSQKCDKMYGEAINVLQADRNEIPFRTSCIVNRFMGRNVLIEGKKTPVSVHTYSRAGKIEVIDYRYLI